MRHVVLVLSVLAVGLLMSSSVRAEFSCGENGVYDELTFYYYRFDRVPPGTPPDQIPLRATCRMKTTHFYWFVANDDWGANGFAADDLAEWVSLFEQQTPGEDGRGVYQIAEDMLGFPRFNDDDTRVVVLFHNLGVLPHRCQKFAYFRPEDFDSESSTRNPYDIIYLHTSDLDAEDTCHSDTTLVRRRAFPEAIKTLASLIVYGNDKDEEPWVIEGLALRLLLRTGFYDGANSDYDWRTDVQVYAHQPNTRFRETNRGTYYEYNNGALVLFFTFFEEQYGAQAVQALVRSEQNGLLGVSDAIQAVEGTESGVEFYGRFTLANWINAGRNYGYTTLNLPNFLPSRVIREIPSEQTVAVAGWCTEYVRIPTDELSADDRIRLTILLPSCSTDTPPVECANPDMLHIRAAQVQQPRDVSFEEPVELLADEAGNPYFVANFAGFGPTTPELMITVSRFNDSQEAIIPLNLTFLLELNPELPVDGDEEVAEPEPEPEPEPELEPEPEPEPEPYVIEKRERNPGASSSGCATGSAVALFGVLVLVRLRRLYVS